MPEELAQRHEVEKSFHDRYIAEGRQRLGRTAFYGADTLVYLGARLLEAVGDLSGKVVLDVGCATGTTSREYARLGAARVEGFDISEESIKRAQTSPHNHGIEDRLNFRCLAAEDIDYPGETFDVALGRAVLHHLDLEKAAPRLCRVLKVGGRAVFIEPLGHNPVINLYRRLTPGARTPTEKPLSLKDIDNLKRHFGSVEYRGYFLLSLVAQAALYVTGSGWLFAKLQALLLPLDEFVLTRIPFLQRFCWSAVITLTRSA